MRIYCADAGTRGIRGNEVCLSLSRRRLSAPQLCTDQLLLLQTERDEPVSGIRHPCGTRTRPRAGPHRWSPLRKRGGRRTLAVVRLDRFVLRHLLTLAATITRNQPRERRRSRSPSRSPPRERRRSPSPRRHRSRSRSPRGDRSRSRSPRRMDVDDQDRDRDRDHRSHSSRPDRSTRYASTGGSGGGGRGPAYGGAPYNPARKAVSREIAAAEAAKRSRKDCRVYVGNLAFGVKWNDLKDFMREGGSLSCRRRVGKKSSAMRLGRGQVWRPSGCKVRRAEGGWH